MVYMYTGKGAKWAPIHPLESRQNFKINYLLKLVHVRVDVTQKYLPLSPGQAPPEKVVEGTYKGVIISKD